MLLVLILYGLVVAGGFTRGLSCVRWSLMASLLHCGCTAALRTVTTGKRSSQGRYRLINSLILLSLLRINRLNPILVNFYFFEDLLGERVLRVCILFDKIIIFIVIICVFFNRICDDLLILLAIRILLRLIIGLL